MFSKELPAVKVELEPSRESTATSPRCIWSGCTKRQGPGPESAIEEIEGRTMTFEDLYPHKDGLAEGYDAITKQIAAEGFEGMRLLYRLGFRTTAIDGLPDRFSIGRVELTPCFGPVHTQRTDIVQRSGSRLIYEKTMHVGLRVGHGRPLLIAQIKATASKAPERDLAALRKEALSAVGVLVASLDERVALEEVFQDAVLLSGDSEQPVLSLDVRSRLRKFYPRFMSDEIMEGLAHLSTVSLKDQPATAMAASWYLKAAQQGPTTDSVVLLWIALEALTASKAEWRNVPKRLKAALEEAEFDVESLPVSIGRLYGLRADIVHHGNDKPDLMPKGWYELEAMCRSLIRHRMGVVSDWPIAVSTNYLGGLQGLAVERRWKSAGRTIMTVSQPGDRDDR